MAMTLLRNEKPIFLLCSFEKPGTSGVIAIKWSILLLNWGRPASSSRSYKQTDNMTTKEKAPDGKKRPWRKGNQNFLIQKEKFLAPNFKSHAQKKKKEKGFLRKVLNVRIIFPVSWCYLWEWNHIRYGEFTLGDGIILRRTMIPRRRLICSSWVSPSLIWVPAMLFMTAGAPSTKITSPSWPHCSNMSAHSRVMVPPKE